jgi:hypothetical protein
MWLSAVLAVLGAVLVLRDPGGLGIPLLVGAAAALGLGAMWRSDRYRLLLRLVAQGDAWSVDGVSELADRLRSQRERLRLADSLRAVAAAGMTGAKTTLMVDPARADAIAPRIVHLAQALADPAVAVSAQAVALCRRLLNEPMRSPLYNPHVPEPELPRVLDLVERGVKLTAAGAVRRPQ